MPNTTRGVGLFTAENIVAVIRAIPESDGTYRDIAVRPSNTAATFTTTPFRTGSATAGLMLKLANRPPPTPDSPNGTESWSTSTADRTTTGTANCDRAIEILERTCECSNDKLLLPDGKLGNTCQECKDLDARQRRRRTG